MCFEPSRIVKLMVDVRGVGRLCVLSDVCVSTCRRSRRY